MSEHINTNEWIKYFSRKSTEEEKLQILRHVAECEACRNLMDKANDFRFALERRKQAGRPLFGAEGMEYAAVAGIYPVSEISDEDGMLTVELIQTETGYLFAEDTLETSGVGEKYAINCSEDCRKLTDEGGALSVVIRDNQILLELNDIYVHASASLLSSQLNEPGVEITPQAILSLPEKGTCLLQIVFEEE